MDIIFESQGINGQETRFGDGRYKEIKNRQTRMITELKLKDMEIRKLEEKKKEELDSLKAEKVRQMTNLDNQIDECSKELRSYDAQRGAITKKINKCIEEARSVNTAKNIQNSAKNTNDMNDRINANGDEFVKAPLDKYGVYKPVRKDIKQESTELAILLTEAARLLGGE